MSRKFTPIFLFLLLVALSSHTSAVDKVTEWVMVLVNGTPSLPVTPYNYANPSLPAFYNTPPITGTDNTPVDNPVTDAGATLGRVLFYDKLLQHESFAPYFEGVSLDRLKEHQFNFMSIAFTKIPDDLDVLDMIRTKHARLIDDLGMNENDFDIVAGDFVATLKELKVPSTVIDEAAGVVLPLRVAFEKE